MLIAAAEWFEGAGAVNEPVVFAGFGAGLSWGGSACCACMSERGKSVREARDMEGCKVREAQAELCRFRRHHVRGLKLDSSLRPCRG